jgi:hypothetical protein
MKKFITIVFALGLTVGSAAAQKPRVFIEESKSSEIINHRGGEHDQTVELIKTFAEKCPAVLINNDKSKADYTVSFDHEGGKGIGQHDNKIAVFNKNGDLLFSRSTVTLGGAVEGACTAIMSDAKMADSGTPENLTGVQVSIHETERMNKFGHPTLTYAVQDDVVGQLKAQGLEVNTTASKVLDITMDRPLMAWAKITLRFISGNSTLWTETVSNGSWGHISETGATPKLLEEVNKALDKHYDSMREGEKQ